MNDQAKIKAQLMDEIKALRRRVNLLEAAEIKHQQVEQTLRDSETRFRNIFNDSNDAILVIDPGQAQILDANPKACNLLGYSRQELLALPLSAIYPQENLLFQTFIDQVSEQGYGWTDQLSCLTQTNQPILAEISASMINLAGKPCLVALMRDISRPKQIEDALYYVAQRGWSADSRTFFQSLAHYLATSLKIDYAFIGMVTAGQEKIKTITFYALGRLVDNIEYNLKDTPCQNIIGRRFCAYAQGVQQQFPNDEMLVELGIESYAGVPLWDSAGQPLGLIVVMDRQPFNPALPVEAILQIVAVQVAHELERQQVEQRLRDSESRYRNLFEESPISLWEEDWSEVKQWVDHLKSKGISDLETYFNRHPEAISHCTQAIKIVDVNRATLKLFKASHKAALLNGLEVIFDEENYRLVALQELLPLFEGQTRHAYEKTNRTLTGDKLHVLVRLAIAPGYEQSWSRVLVSVTDITGHKQIEQALRESEARYRSVIMAMAEGVVLQDAEGVIQTCNANAERILGLSVAQMMGRTSIDPRWRAIHEDGTPFPGHAHPAMVTLQTGQVQANVIMGVHKPDGRLTWISINSQPLFRAGETKPYAVVASFTDITDRKQAEQEIRRRNRELTLLNRVIEAATVDQVQPEMVLETACRELALAFNLTHAVAALLSQDKRQATIVAEYRAADRPSWLADVIPVIELTRSEYVQDFKKPWLIDETRTEARFKPLLERMRHDGLTSMLLLPLLIKAELIGALSLNTIQPRYFLDEEINLAVQVANQVSSAVARARLTQTRQLLTTALEQSAESVIITDTNGTILYVNPAFERVTGYTQAEALNQNPRLLKGDRQDDAFYRELWQTITAGQVWQGRFINQKKDGSLYTEQSTITPVRDQGSVIVNYVAVQRDVTHELRLEAQYRQAQKMEAVGQLAGGIAHDFNNILTIIIGNCGLMLDSLGQEHPLHKDITQIQNAAGQAASLTRQLLAFSRRQVLQPKVLDLNAIISNIEKMLHRLIGEDMELVTVLAPDLGQIKIDPGQIEQVIMNLVINARDAMPTGGKLLIETANAYLDESYVQAYADTEIGTYVLLAVSDTGYGMDQETMAHVFEPFFTTKAMGQGTGLGLATVHGIVKQSGGYIRVYSEPGYGTTFKIYLPTVEQPLEPARPDQIVTGTASGLATILLVEDEIAVREIAGRILRSQGYQVLEANNGEEAYQLASQHQGRIDLLLTDVVMPGDLSGPQLAESMMAQHPPLKVLYMSGYTDNIIVHHGVLKAGINFLQKPFSPTILLRKVQDVLRIEN